MSDGGAAGGPEGGSQALTPRALDRRVKRWLLGAPFGCFVQCPAGLERTLAAELTALGLGQAVEIEMGGVSVLLSPVEIARANLELRCATRVLLRLDEFYAGSSEALFDHVRRVPWEVQLGFQGEYRLNLTSRLSKLQAGDAVERTISLAIARRLADVGQDASARGETPSSVASSGAPASGTSALEFSFRLYNDRCYASLNTSGEPLHRRGTRRHIGEAPLRESLAAALALTGYRGQDVVLDPFCGSGTVLIETSDLVDGRLPGRNRGFAFRQAAWFRQGMWNEALRQAMGTAAPPKAVRVVGCDIDAAALAAARRNLSSLSSPDYAGVELLTADSARIDLDEFQHGRRGLLLSNLPYGVRLADRSRAAAVIEAFLERCEAASSEWDFVFLTQHPAAFQGRSRTRVSSMTAVNNGGLRVHMVSGSIGGA